VIYFIRHAQSIANKQRFLASRLPVPLTEAGLEDSKSIARELRQLVKIEKIYSSPLLRALQTAEFFAQEFFVDIQEDLRLAEQDFGMFSGMSYDQVRNQKGYEPNPLKRWDWKPGQGESYKEIADRVRDFFLDKEKELLTNNVLLVTHAVTFRLIRGLLENTLPVYSETFPNNGEIWKVDYLGLGQPHRIESLFLGNSHAFHHLP